MVAFPGKLEQGSRQKPVPSHWITTLVYKTGCALLNIEVTVSRIKKFLTLQQFAEKVTKICVYS